MTDLLPLPGNDEASAEHLYLGMRATAESIITTFVRNARMREPDGEDFRAFVHERLIDRNCHKLRSYAGRSSVEAYLRTVVSRLLQDYRNHSWGRWRPSQFAKAHGETAVRLEELLYRDGYPLREAVEKMASDDPSLSEREIRALAVRLPRREAPRVVALELATEVDVGRGGRGDDAASRDDEARVALADCVKRLVGELSTEEQVIVTMRYWDKVSVADIARALHLEARPLYRRLEDIEKRMRPCLERRGFSRDLVNEILRGDEGP